MSENDIAGRMRDYFRRQLDWLHTACEEMRAFDEELAADPEALQERDARRAREAEALAAEFAVLKREWDACRDIGEADRNAVQQLAVETEARAKEMSELVDRNAATARAKAQGVQEDLDTLRRGKGAIEGYRQGDAGPRLDRQG
jgi:hypothetical protein